MTFLERLLALDARDLAAFGDSITVGLAASRPEFRWVDRLAVQVGIRDIRNAAVSGTVLQNAPMADGKPRPDNGWSRFERALLRPEPADALVILYGYNDARYTGAPATMNATNFKAGLRAMLTVLIENGYRDRLALGSPPYPCDKAFAVGSAGFLGQTRQGFEAYVKATREVARDGRVFYAPVYESMRAHADGALAAPDVTHPNDHGHRVIAEAFAGARVE